MQAKKLAKLLLEHPRTEVTVSTIDNEKIVDFEIIMTVMTKKKFQICFETEGK